MDFTFDNPFDDVFTDPNALLTPPAAAVAPVPVQPVQVVQPVQNHVAPIQNYQQPPTTVAPMVYAPQTVVNPVVHTPPPQSTSPVVQNPAIPAQQLYTPPVAAQNPVFSPPMPSSPVVATNNFQQNPAIAPQVPVGQQPFNPALGAGVGVQSPLVTPQTMTAVSNPVQMPVQQTPQVTSPTQTANVQQPASVAPAATDASALNPNDIWREAKAPNGRIYYYKKSTRETTWTKPATYIPLGGTVPISSAGGAAPAAAATTPVAATTVGVVPTANTPLTGFNLSALSSTPTSATPLSSSGASDNPGLVGGVAVQNPALMAGANPAIGGANPSLGMNSGALSASNPSLSNSSSSLGGSNQSLGAPSNPSLFAQVGALGTPAQTAGLTNSNPALMNPALGGGMNVNPALGGQNTGMVPSPSNPTVSTGMTPNPALGTMEGSGSQQNLALGGGYGVSAGQMGQFGNGVDESAQNGGMASGQQLGYQGDAAQQSPVPQQPQMQQVQQVLYDANGQIMYDANGQVMYTIVEVPIDPSQQQYDPNYQQQQPPYGFDGQGQTDPNMVGYNPQTDGQYDPNTGMPIPNGQFQANGVVGEGQPMAAATSSAPSTPSFPKTFKVRLPADQRQVVPFKAEQTLRQVLSKICGARGLSMDDYLPKDRSGMDISLDKTLAEINQEEISFLTPRAGVVPQDETKRKAHKIMSDIYEANAGLSSSLQAIIKNYRDPLLKSAQDVDMRKRLLSEQECNQIFASIESITSMTKDFMSHLSAQLSVWPVDLTEMITRHSEVLTFYNEFVNNYRANMNKLEDLRRNPDFAAFVDGVQRSLGSKLRLEDFMALPAVKIAATSTLMEQLIAVLTDQHPNFFMLRDFHQRLQPIANQATSLRLQMEARSKIVMLEATIVKFPKKASFLHDQRIFFRDGVFELGTKKKPALCYVALFTDLMIVCKAPEKKKNKPTTPPTFEEIIAFGPTDCTVEEVGSQGWNLHVDAGKGKFTVNCSIHTSSEYSKAEWVKAFKDAFHDFSGKPHLKPPVL